MTTYDNTNSGLLMKNDRKETDKHPDYRGSINVNGQDVKMPFIIGSGEGGSAFKPGEPKPPIPPIRTRQHWRIDNTNR